MSVLATTDHLWIWLADRLPARLVLFAALRHLREREAESNAGLPAGEPRGKESAITGQPVGIVAGTNIIVRADGSPLSPRDALALAQQPKVDQGTLSSAGADHWTWLCARCGHAALHHRPVCERLIDPRPGVVDGQLGTLASSCGCLKFESIIAAPLPSARRAGPAKAAAFPSPIPGGFIDQTRCPRCTRWLWYLAVSSRMRQWFADPGFTREIARCPACHLDLHEDITLTPARPAQSGEESTDGPER